jgi:SPP1 gp7 family putative phage head morphogenesis protein
MVLATQPAPIVVIDRESFRQAVRAQHRAGRLKHLRRPPAAHVPRLLEREYYKALTRVLDDLLAHVRRVVLPRLPGIVASAPAELRGDAEGTYAQRRDQFDDQVQSLIGEVKIQFLAQTKSAVKIAARSTARKVAEAQDRDHKRAVQSVLGVRPELEEPWLQPVIDNFISTNARLIEDLSENALDGVARRIGDGVRSGLGSESIAEQIVDDLDRAGESITLNRARLIAEDQVGSLYGDLARVRNQKLGINRYTWSTSLDERVRPTHREREGETFHYDEPIEPQLRAKGLDVDNIDGHPGKPIRCRCVGIPVFGDLLEGAPEVMDPREEQRSRPTPRLVQPQHELRPAADEPRPVVTTKTISVTLGDRALEFKRDRISKDARQKLILVRVADLDRAWERDAGFYIQRGGGGAEIEGRRAGFERFLETLAESGEAIEAPRIDFNEALGRVSFGNGRHRFSVLRDMGLTEIPVAVDADEVDAVARAFARPRRRSIYTGEVSATELP